MLGRERQLSERGSSSYSNMDSIFHERQEGQLCAQHCLNNLLQGPYFSPVDLAKFASELDEAEKTTMAEGGFDSAEFIKFMQQPSANMDDSGYFSVQVISKALSVWTLSMVPLSSPQMKVAMETPTSEKAFICNHEHHWLTIRKLGRQWFNLDSLQRRPELISDTYLKLFLTQLQLEGYSIFVVNGELPSCEADQLLTLVPIQPSPTKPTTPGSRFKGQRATPTSPTSPTTPTSSNAHSKSEEDYALELAMAMSASMAMSQPQQQPRAGVQKAGTVQSGGSKAKGEGQQGGASEGAKTLGSGGGGGGGKGDKDRIDQPQLTPEQLRQKRLEHFKN